MRDIDTIDHKILQQLQRNSDDSLEDIGARIGLSRNAVWRRIKALEDTGIIKKRLAVLDPSRLGLGLMVFIQLRTSNHSAEWLGQFTRAVSTIPEIQGAFRMTGDLDYLIQARVSDVSDYDALYQRLISKVDMTDVSASFVMEEIKNTTELPI